MIKTSSQKKTRVIYEFESEEDAKFFFTKMNQLIGLGTFGNRKIIVSVR
jgi:hypothetical protein